MQQLHEEHQPERISLNPVTANQYLLLSEENRAAERTSSRPYPDHPERFDRYPQVLGRESLGGRSYWEVELGGKEVYISVSYKSIERKGWGAECLFGRNSESWSLRWTPKSLSFWFNNKKTKLPGASSGSRIGVYVDRGAGILSFYSVSHTMSLIHSIRTSFTEPLYPGFGLLGSADHRERRRCLGSGGCGEHESPLLLYGSCLGSRHGLILGTGACECEARHVTFDSSLTSLFRGPRLHCISALLSCTGLIIIISRLSTRSRQSDQHPAAGRGQRSETSKSVESAGDPGERRAGGAAHRLREEQIMYRSTCISGKLPDSHFLFLLRSKMADISDASDPRSHPLQSSGLAVASVQTEQQM
ncbi:hypothetical protein DNTS_014323 [Danionella cerebrum]|uniref:B30.2/SPRY domain-containing protein n=1 Tax=Danionella cerebrum TaxID=2873325 RepID=A0A553QQE8_9TELE|nr:hypothetical protein DNTS_014323 [Danionella translucida]